MIRFILTTVLFVLFSMPIMAVQNVAHSAKYTTSCKKCEGLVDAYNKAMEQLFYARIRYNNISEDLYDETWNDGEIKNKIEKEMGDAEGLKDYMEANIGILSEARGVSQDIEKNDMPKLKQAIENLEYSTKDLKTQIETCEKQCKTSETDEKLGALGVPPGGGVIQLPFDWKGPYDAVCEDCAKLALRLNSLPAAALKNLAELDAAETERIMADIQVKILKRDSVYRQYSDKAKQKALKELQEAERELKGIEGRIKRLENDYAEFQKNFKQTLAEYNKCIKTCKGAEEPKKGACVFPDNRPAIAIGPNNEFGSGKQFENKVKGQAKGMAMGALGGLMGGSGVSLGGGGGGEPGSPMGGSKQEPQMDKDPTSGSFTAVSAGGADLGIRAGFTDEGLVVSTEIDDTPSDGTFHAQWLEDGNGKIYLPRRYLLIDIYRDWKLSVWWDYKRWRDNELVEHRSGDSMTVGSDYIGTIKLFEGARGVAKSIWHSLGFGTAVKGAKHIGAVFDVPPAALTGPCPLALVTHISEPKKDPVTTIPVVGSLFAQGGGQSDDSELVIKVTPGIVELAE